MRQAGPSATIVLQAALAMIVHPGGWPNGARIKVVYWSNDKGLWWQLATKIEQTFGNGPYDNLGRLKQGVRSHWHNLKSEQFAIGWLCLPGEGIPAEAFESERGSLLHLG